MTVRQLLLALQHVDPNIEVHISYQGGCTNYAKSIEVGVEDGKQVIYVSTEEPDEDS